MDDLIRDLRAHVVDCYGGKNDTMRMAADAIEGLQADLAEARDKALEDAAMLMQRHGFGGSAAAIRAMKGERG